MVEFAGYTFDDHKASFVCTHVIEAHPILLFVHEADGDIQFMCGATGHANEEVRVIGIIHLLEQLQSMGKMPVVRAGFLAERDAPGAPWRVQSVEAE